MTPVFRDPVTEKLRAIASPQRRAAAAKEGGKSARDFMRRFYQRKDAAEPNSFFNAGSIRTHFWKQIGASIDPEVTSKDYVVTVSVRDYRIRQKVYGGTLVPVKAKALTIPTHPDAHGVTARVLEQQLGIKLFLLRVRGEAYLAAKKGRSVVRYYLLRRSVTQKPWPNSLPSARQMRRAFVDGMRKYWKAWKARKFAT